MPVLLALLRANWKVAAIGAVVFLLAGTLYARDARQQRTIREQGAKIDTLLDQMRTRPQTIAPADLERLLALERQGMMAEIRRQSEFFAESLRLVAGRGGQPIIIREVGPPSGPAGPPGAPGSPGAPGQPGPPSPPHPDTPLVPAAKLPAVREGATERIVTTFWPGHLVGCVTPGFDEPDALEILRDPDGRLLSGANCVKSIRDEIRLQPARPVEVRLPYYLGAFVSQSFSISPTVVQTTKFGVEYTNRVWKGFYRIEAACVNVLAQGQICPAQRFELRYIQPIF